MTEELVPPPEEETLPEEEALPRYKRLAEAVEAGDEETAQEIISEASADDQRRIIAQLDLGTREKLCELLPADEVADLLENLAEVQAVELLEEMPAGVAADVVEEMDADVSGDLLRELDQKDSDAILAELDDAKESKELRERASYEWDSAGGLMSDQVVSFRATATVSDVLADLDDKAEEYSDADVQYFFVVNARNKLTGVLALRSLVLGRRATPIGDLMRSEVLSVNVDTKLDELEDIFDAKAYLGLPVVDSEGRLRGVVTRQAIEEALAEQQTEDYLKSSGIVGGEELRSMPLKDRCLRRLAWLGPNILLNLLAASVIASYEDTLQAVIALAIFLPMVSDMSGCSGNQAVAVSIRELTLGVIQPRDFKRVMIKEGLLGVTNGIVLGIVLGTIAAVWKGSIFLGLVIGSALTLNTILSVLLGGLIPLVLKRFKADPALASGPILTTCTDMCGFFLVLNLASMALSRL
ncbi:magnesium transporter [Akkermansiaceae bacterium]|nr:magnesium transporter [Akkermansiaceae bacterium]MDB4276673.1 magnesium transporter [bacterium]MDA7864325.1 magnesium transporter [Akkermansiaceae bacterium]MDA7877167.1 magnesium transporter [Akkermansiaceae bacterium]MDB0056216.1 magnesium transporter [Akkermansiaceae bacterium]